MGEKNKDRALSLEGIAEVEDPKKGIEELYNWIWTNSKEGKAFDENPNEIKEYIAIWWMDTEVNNGSFHQYFWNSTGDGALDALNGLKRIGAAKTLNILKSAINWIGDNPYPVDHMKRQDLLESFTDEKEDELYDISQEYYKNQEDLDGLLFTYFKSHFDDFYTEPDEEAAEEAFNEMMAAADQTLFKMENEFGLVVVDKVPLPDPKQIQYIQKNEPYQHIGMADIQKLLIAGKVRLGPYPKKDVKKQLHECSDLRLSAIVRMLTEDEKIETGFIFGDNPDFSKLKF
jgi:hypothetical protein